MLKVQQGDVDLLAGGGLQLEAPPLSRGEAGQGWQLAAGQDAGGVMQAQHSALAADLGALHN